MRIRSISLIAFTALFAGPPALACSICGGDFRARPTMRQEADAAVVVVFGTLHDARLNSDPLDGTGTTGLKIGRVLKGENLVRAGAEIRIPRYLPREDKSPDQALVFLVRRGEQIGYAGHRLCKSASTAEYLADLLAIAANNAGQRLEYCFRRLDHADAEISADAFLELARAADADMARAAPKFDPVRLRRLLADERTHAERIGFLGFLLGCCGADDDARLLLRLIDRHGKESPSALRGLTAGYIGLRPADGWKRALAILGDPQRAFLDRHAMLGVLDFYRTWKPTEFNKELLQGMKYAIVQADLADLAAESLRRWGWWDLTDLVLAQYDRSSHDSEIVRKAILRYALTCPTDKARVFVAAVRKRAPEMVVEVEEALREEK